MFTYEKSRDPTAKRYQVCVGAVQFADELSTVMEEESLASKTKNDKEGIYMPFGYTLTHAEQRQANRERRWQRKAAKKLEGGDGSSSDESSSAWRRKVIDEEDTASDSSEESEERRRKRRKPAPPRPPQPNAAEDAPKTGAQGGARGVFAGPKYDHYDVYDDDGTYVGYILHNTNNGPKGSLDAHCACCAGDCSTSRTCSGWDDDGVGAWTGLRSARGRPLGFLVAWLRLGRHFATREKHLEAMKNARQKSSPLYSGKGALRQRARDWVIATPSFRHLRVNAERLLRDNEEMEPDGQF